MNCKNCNEILESDAHFCDNCGAKVMTNRITLRFLIGELFASMGFESLYFATLKGMILSPHKVIKEYLGGVRKRYVNPFAYLALGAALSLIIFNFFSDDFFKAQASFNQGQIEQLKKVTSKDLSTVKNISEKELTKLKLEQNSAKIQLNFIENYSQFLLRYFNLAAFLFLPFYALLSKMTYYKPHNYGEHIVINAYIQGTTMYISIFCFLLSIVINPKIFSFSLFFVIPYYLYTLGKMYNYSFKKSVIKFFKFIGVLLLLLIPIMIIGVIVGIVIGFKNAG